MTMITAPELEIAVLVLGMAILLVEAFATKIDKRVLAFAGIAGLTLVLVASFFVATGSSTSQATGFWSFYTADRLSIFFKRFSLVTTIFVLILMTDYAPVLRSSFPGATLQAGLGEFFALPIFTCVGLMYLVSAIDFVFIFVSLELVTISFYVLVSFTRRNPITLEAGTKYLVLSALSTAFLVYGIAWIFGVTGQTNLQRIADELANPATDRNAALFGMVLILVALGFKIAAVPFQGGGIRRAAPSVAAIPGAASNAALNCRDRAADFDLWKSRGSAAGESETTACLLKYRARRLSADRRSVFRRVSHRLLPCRLSAHDAA